MKVLQRLLRYPLVPHDIHHHVADLLLTRLEPSRLEPIRHLDEVLIRLQR